MKDIDTTIGMYLTQINKTPLLSIQEEKDLCIKMHKGDAESEKARNQFVEANLRFVVKLAKQFLNQGLSLSDLIQEGNIGLIEAVERFNPNLGFRFSTFSAYWIRQAMQRGIAKKARQIRLPVRKHRALAQMEYVRSNFFQEYGRYPNILEISKIIKLSPKTVKQLIESRETPISLESPVSSENHTDLTNFIEDKESNSPRKLALSDQLRKQLEKVLGFLSERERNVLLWRYGFFSGDDVSLRNISKKIGLSQEGVRRIEKEALSKLRRPAIKSYLEGFI